MEGQPNKSRKAKSSKCSMDKLDDSLLEEIFHRIPCIKSLVHCTSVSHHWFNLISNPFFINRQPLYPQRPKPFTLMLNCHGPASKDAIFQSPGFKLSFLPRKSLRILSSCNDLILCYSIRGRSVYYICNPLTLKWLALPPATQNYNYDQYVKFGLLSNYQVFDNENQWKHRLVRIHDEGSNLVAGLFSFEMGDWTETFVLGQYYELYGNSVAYNGVLHWLAEPSAIISYDFDDKDRYRLVSCPITRTMIEYPFCSQCLGVCCGVLRILELAAFPDSDDDSLTVWELEDYPDGNWNVERRIRYKELVAAGDPRVQIEERGKHQWRLRALGIHPTDRDVVFLQINEYVVSCNLETRELKTEATTNQLVHMHAAFPVEPQLWPTPIPTLS